MPSPLRRDILPRRQRVATEGNDLKSHVESRKRRSRAWENLSSFSQCFYSFWKAPGTKSEAWENLSSIIDPCKCYKYEGLLIKVKQCKIVFGYVKTSLTASRATIYPRESTVIQHMPKLVTLSIINLPAQLHTLPNNATVTSFRIVNGFDVTGDQIVFESVIRAMKNLKHFRTHSIHLNDLKCLARLAPVLESLVVCTLHVILSLRRSCCGRIRWRKKKCPPGSRKPCPSTKKCRNRCGRKFGFQSKATVTDGIKPISAHT